VFTDCAGPTRGRPHLGREGALDVAGTGAVLSTPRALGFLAEAYAQLGRPVEGLNCLGEAAQIIETTDERLDEAELHRLRGDLLRATGDAAAAEASYREALALACRQSAKLWELRTAASLARLWRDQGKRTEAYNLLAPVYGWFTEGFDTPVLRDAKALLDQLAWRDHHWRLTVLGGKEDHMHLISDLLSVNLLNLAHFNFAATLGFIGVLFHLPSYYMKTTIPRRVAAIIGNCFLVAYGYLYPSYTTLLLCLLILPINVFRLYQMLGLIKQVKIASQGFHSLEWLKPFMTDRRYNKGDLLFHKGNVAEELL
jgi:tetratricopeptide (TPR) repeat protein